MFARIDGTIACTSTGVRRIRAIGAAAAFASSAAVVSSAHAAETDAIEMTAFGGLHVREEYVRTPFFDCKGQPYTHSIGAGAVGGAELAYRHDFASWSFATGLRAQYESYALDGLFAPPGPNQTYAPCTGMKYVGGDMTSFRETMASVGVPLRAQLRLAPGGIAYLVAEPMVIAHARVLYGHTTYDGQPLRTGVIASDDRQYVSVYGALGVGVPVGPGFVVFEIGGRGSVQTHIRDDKSTASGWSLILGYRVGLR
jgi:hypothetical protein